MIVVIVIGLVAEIIDGDKNSKTDSSSERNRGHCLGESRTQETLEGIWGTMS